MSIFFSLTTPVGIAIGIGIANAYDENSPNALIVQGSFDSASAGILIYMALVDLLAADFMNPRLQSNRKLQFGANFSLLLGAACMSMLAKWAWPIFLYILIYLSSNFDYFIIIIIFSISVFIWKTIHLREWHTFYLFLLWTSRKFNEDKELI